MLLYALVYDVLLLCMIMAVIALFVGRSQSFASLHCVLSMSSTRASNSQKPSYSNVSTINSYAWYLQAIPFDLNTRLTFIVSLFMIFRLCYFSCYNMVAKFYYQDYVSYAHVLSTLIPALNVCDAPTLGSRWNICVKCYSLDQ
jgi:hypothetical protein